ncbi:flavin reductase family protein [Streptomyces sp. P38-E01]|uniref:Flavin reductase family protein n=1 Tax=Streptomyces tardus TaxID=2780544 RepID=A0A949JMI0_9ACTN|nr:flavin reductase family protein [Streptomyces tardus]MBU7597841.1 flavin reductase family protein [Streptomyces tardus]
MSTQAAPARPQAVRRRNAVLRSLASGVAVLTVRSGDRLHGTTVSTLTSVSRKPLIIGVCLRPGSAMADLVRTEERFVANVLSGEQHALARWFANRARPEGAAQFDEVSWMPGSRSAGGAPLLDGAVAQLTCRLSSCVPVGDHEVLLGLVTEATANGGEPLLSYAGALHAPVLYDPAANALPPSALPTAALPTAALPAPALYDPTGLPPAANAARPSATAGTPVPSIAAGEEGKYR